MTPRRGLVLLLVAALAGCLDASPVAPPEGGTTTTTPPATTTPTPAPPSPDEPDPPQAPPNGTLSVHYVDVGQGDGVILRFPDGTTVVYDCGESFGQGAFSPMVAQLRALGVARIHALVVSHGHADHAGGCPDVLEAFPVDHVYDGWYAGDDRTLTYRGFQAAALAEGARLHTLRDVPERADEERLAAGALFDLPASTGARATLLFPPAPVATNWDGIAKESLVVRLAYGETTFCFQGDVTTREEATLAALPGDVTCTVYLVGHHGSRDASTAAWLARMKPAVAVASFGENDYGHPTPEALCRIQQAGAKVYATQRLGTVTVTSDGRNLTLPEGAEPTDYCAAGASYWEEDLSSAATPPTPPPATTQPTAPTPPPSQPTSPTPPPAEPTPPPPTEPTPPPTTTTPPPPSGPLQVTASVSDATPCQYATVTVSVTVRDAGGNPVPGASVLSTWNYRTTTSTESGTTNAAGQASLSRGISRATAGYTVVVDVDVTGAGSTGRASTSFTPRDC